MTVQNSTQLSDHVKALKQQRKDGQLAPKAYYGELLGVLKDLTDSLIDELEVIDDSQVRTQIPLLVVLLDDQIRTLAERSA